MRPRPVVGDARACEGAFGGALLLPRTPERGTTTPAEGRSPPRGEPPTPRGVPRAGLWDMSFRSVRQRGWTSALAAALLVLLASGAVATAVGAVRYPGGSWVDPDAAGHSLWANFLCDL